MTIRNSIRLFWILTLAVSPCLAASVATPGFEDLLATTGRNVDRLTSELSDVKCTEHVTQEKFGKNGKVEDREESTFDYLVSLSSADGGLTLDESRMAVQQGTRKKNVPLLITNGFSMLFLVFHPYYAGSFEFTDEGKEAVDAVQAQKIHFRHLRNTRSPIALALRGREYPLELQGDAWVDPATGTVLRIAAAIPAGIDDLGLRSLRAEVKYSPFPFHHGRETWWLPSIATIELETPRQHWRNIHRFLDYKRFDVDTQQAVSENELKP
jgi:hypothetical protein